MDELSRNGRVLFARLPLEVFSKPARLRSFYPIFYNM